jgi:cytochrome c-type biogenesis protein
MSDVTLVGVFLAGLLSFLSPCVLPLVPGYISMLSGIGMEQLRKGELPKSGLFGSALAFVAGFSAVFISFGASASAVGTFLRVNRGFLAPIAGALILLFGLHLIGVLIKLNLRTGIIIGVVLWVLGIVSLVRNAPLFAGLRAIHFFSLSLIGFLGPSMARWLNRDVRLQSKIGQPGVWSAFVLGFAFAFGWTPCIGPILAAILSVAAAEATVTKGASLLAVYSAGLGIPFLLAALMVEQFSSLLARMKRHLANVERAMGVLMVLTGVGFLTGAVSNVSIWLLETFPALQNFG